MIEKNETSQKPVGTREWYDFIGQLAEALPGIHMGGQDATHALLELCQLDDEPGPRRWLWPRQHGLPHCRTVWFASPWH